MIHTADDDETVTAAAVCARLRAARAAYDKTTCATLLDTDAAYEAALAAFSTFECANLADLVLMAQVMRERLDEETQAIAESEASGEFVPPSPIRADRCTIAAAVFSNLRRLAVARQLSPN